ncbi:MAG: ATP-binding protein [Roseateles sp.]|uniref:ATP-binding protein n=1 Tax=Roseateles sp. TaxID=1971397 RepID=UPI0039EC279E
MDPVTQALRPRAYLGLVKQLLMDEQLRRAVVLLGPRRVGKTILIRHLIADLLAAGVPAHRVAYVEMDHPLLHGQSLADLIQQFEAIAPDGSGTRYVFFDDVQSHKDWEKHLKPLVDHRPDLRILVSGSAAAAPAMYTGLFGAQNPDHADFGHLVETAVFSQRFHEDARLNYAKWGTDDAEVDLVESSQSLQPIAALEIKWSDRHLERPELLRSLCRFARRHQLPLTWATTRSRFGEVGDVQNGIVRCWPAAALAFHYGVRAVNGRMADFEARIKGMAA